MRAFLRALLGVVAIASMALLFLPLTACAPAPVGPTAEQFDRASFGGFPAGFEDTIKAYYADKLHDPASVQYRNFTAPRKYWLGDRFSSDFGYLVCVTYNSKGWSGNYAGFKTDGFLLRGKSVERFLSNGDWDGGAVC